jgi:predicted lipid-binding transport protein (Tim44 family)
MAQQVSLAIGVTIGGYALTMASLATGQPMDAVINFSFAFLTVGLISGTSLWMMLKLAPDAGAEMSGKAEPGKEVTEPKPEQRPGN